MVELLGITVLVLAVGVIAGAAVRELVLDGGGRRRPGRPGRPDPTGDWSQDLPSRPYREV